MWKREILVFWEGKRVEKERGCSEEGDGDSGIEKKVE